jgi:hypothetical protein
VFNKPAKTRQYRLFFASLLLVMNLGLAACGEATQSPAPTTAALPATAVSATATLPVTTINPSPTAATTRPVTTAAATTAAVTTAPATTAATRTTQAATAATPVRQSPATTQPASAVGPSKASLAQLDKQSTGIIAYENEGDIWAMVLPEGMQRKLTNDGANTRIAFPSGYNRRPVWAPGSLSIAFASPADASLLPGYQDGYDIFTMRPDGSNRTRLTKAPDSAYVERLPLGWISSKEIIISQHDNKNQQSGLAALAILDVATGKIKDLPIKQSGVNQVAVSPDGTQLAYVVATADAATRRTKADVYVVPLAGGQPKGLTDLPAGEFQSISALTWSPNGQNLAFTHAIGDGCGTYTLYSVTREGKDLRKLADGPGYPLTLSYAVSGAWLAYSGDACAKGPALQLVNTAKGGPALDLGSGSNPSYGKQIGG